MIPPVLRFISAEKRAKKPSETLFRAALQAVATRGIPASDVLHVGSNLTRDIAPAKKMGMRTALYAGDRLSLAAPPEQIKEPAFRPDVLLTDLTQLLEVIG